MQLGLRSLNIYRNAIDYRKDKTHIVCSLSLCPALTFLALKANPKDGVLCVFCLLTKYGKSRINGGGAAEWLQDGGGGGGVESGGGGGRREYVRGIGSSGSVSIGGGGGDSSVDSGGDGDDNYFSSCVKRSDGGEND